MGEHFNKNTHRPSLTTSVDRPVAQENVCGGNVQGCLSDGDLDRLAGPLVAGHWVDARAFYDARTGVTSFPALRQRIDRDLGDQLQHGSDVAWLVLPLHTRHHWATALVRQRTGEQPTAAVFDSALSAATARDWKRAFAALGIPCAISMHARQPRDSLECGLHVLLLAARWANCAAHKAPPSHPPFSTGTLSLSNWRALLAGRDWDINALAKAVPESVDILGARLAPRIQEAQSITAAGPTAPANSSSPTATTVGPPQVAQSKAEAPAEDLVTMLCGEAASVCRWDIPLLKEPLSKAPPSASEGVIVVEDDEGEYPPPTWDVLQAHAQTLGLSADELEALRAEFTALHVARLEEERERRTGLTEAQMAFGRVVLPLHGYPENLRQRIAALSREYGQAALGPEHWRQVFKAKAPGVMLSTTIVDAALEAMARASSAVHVVACGFFYVFAALGRAAARRPGECPVPPPSPLARHVCTVIHTQNPPHFVAAWFDIGRGQLHLFDSLRGASPAARPSAELRQRLGRFRALLEDWGHQSKPSVLALPCAAQACNDCGIEALSNVARVIRAVSGAEAPAHLIPRTILNVGWKKGMEAFREAIRTAVVGANAIATTPAPPPPPAGLPREALENRLSVIAPSTRAIVKFANGVERRGVIFEPQGRRDQRQWQVQWDEGEFFTDELIPASDYRGDVVAITTIEAPRTHNPYAPVLRAPASPALSTAPPDCGPSRAEASLIPAPPALSATKSTAAAKTIRTTPPVPDPPAATDKSVGQKLKTARASCCGRDFFADERCPWHHPQCAVNFGRCTDSNSRGKRCHERVLAILDAKLSQCVWSCDRCWFHASVRQRADAVAALTAPAPDTKHGLQVVCQPGTALSHITVRGILAAQSAGTLLRFDCSTQEIFSCPRCVVIGRVCRAATSILPATVEFLARWCPRCDEWHAADVAPQRVPAVDVAYFGISVATPDVVRVLDPDSLTPECVESEAGSDVADDDDQPSVGALAAADTSQFLDDVLREPLFDSGGHAAPSASRLDTARQWMIYASRPLHVPRIAWAAMAPSTRAEHTRWLLRLKNAPPELSSWPLARAALEIVLRTANERHWRWSTIASRLSAMKSALRNLPLYSNMTTRIDIGEDAVFAAATAKAQRLARAEATHPLLSRPLTFTEFRALQRKLTMGPRLLLTLAWWTASRVGDARRLRPNDVHCDIDKPDKRGFVPLSALFSAGKGAYFCGPYTVHTRVPLEEAKVVAEHIRVSLGASTLFTVEDQRVLSRAVGELPDSSLRSIRKGSLHFFAEAGATDSQLQLLSAHRRRDTLMRYLGWGVFSSEARAAAQSRADLIADTVEGAGHHPLWMGRFSGFSGPAGRRMKPPPELFALKAPSRSDVGLPDDSSDAAQWPLHVKPEVKPLDIDAAPSLVSDAELRRALEKGIAYLHDPRLLGADWAPLTPSQLPRTSFTPAHWQTMFRGGKCAPLRQEGTQLVPVNADGTAGTPFDIRSACRGFPVPQPAKRRLRPVFEPLTNATTSRAELPPLHYPARQERRLAIARALYALDFDFSAWYDQVRLGVQTEPYFVCRAAPTEIVLESGASEVFCYFGLSRVPMGASWSAHVMQTLTWCLLEPLLAPSSRFFGRVAVVTMIDNVCLASDDPVLFAEAVEVFLQRCRAFGAQLNDADALPRSRQDIIARGATKGRPFTFLGEEFLDGNVRNTARNVEKLRDAFSRLQSAAESSSAVTRRQVASLISLAVWMAHTLNISLREHFDVHRLFSRIAADASGDRWDSSVPVQPRWLTVIGRLVGPLLANAWVAPVAFPSSKTIYDEESYDAVVVSDASGTGLGAVVRFAATGKIFECRQGWRTHQPHSAWAEPIAARAAVEWARQQGARSIALVTDHIALALGQRRPTSGNGGFSTQFFVNELYKTLYAVNGQQQIFFVEGVENPADAPSRATMVGDPQWRVRAREDMTFPGLRAFAHPYHSQTSARTWWNV